MFRTRRVDPRRMASVPERHDPGEPDTSEAVRKRVARRAWTFLGYPDTVPGELLDRVTVFEGSPAVTLLSDVWYLPGLLGLYASDGTIIEETAVRLGARRELSHWQRQRVTPPRDFHRVAERLIYVGNPFQTHYGHLLLESIVRLWHAADDLDAPLLCHDIHPRRPKTGWVDDFYGVSDLRRDRFISFGSPVLLNQVVLPSSTLPNGGAGYDVHRRLTELVATRLVSSDLRTTEQPVYMSRARLSRTARRVVGEDALTDHLERRGFAIVHPQLMTLREQIDVFNRHDVVVGAIGSAFHGTLFRLRPDQRTVTLSRTWGVPHQYLTVDAIKSTKASYVGALDEVTRSVKKGTHRNVTLDRRAALDALTELGLLTR